MKISILGTGDMTKILRFTNLSKEKLRDQITKVAELIAKKGHEIVIIPDRGIPTEMAKAYKAAKGKKVYGVVPVNDKKYGARHIEEYLNLVDEQIKVDSWYDANGEIAAAGDICLVFGVSPGIMIEICVLKYHYRYLKSKTRLVWFRNTLLSPLPQEIEEELPIQYITTTEELEKLL